MLYQYTNSVLSEKDIVEGVRSYSFRLQYYYDHYVVHESAPDFLHKLSAEYLREYLTKYNRFGYRFRTRPNQAGQQCFEVQIVRLSDSDGFKAVMGYRYIDDIIAEQEKQKIQLEKALADATLNSEIVDSISKIYWLIYRMDLLSGIYEEVSAGHEMHKLTGKRGSTEEVFKEICGTIVSEQHRKIMERFLDTSTLADRLQNTESIAMEYCSSSGSWHLARFIVKKRNEEGKVINVLYVVRQIDQQKQQELEYKQKLLDAAEEARRANIAKTDFLRRMSHDIRTPINGIQGMLAIADHYPEDMEKQKECRDKVKEAAGFLIDLVNSILDMNKLESGTTTLEHTSFDLITVLQEVIVKWPMSVIRLQGRTTESIVEAADHILTKWRGYSDPEVDIFSETDGIPHNTITPIARMHGDLYELDLVLRNNITTDECPLGLFHPHAEYHHIKKENIGLIEVMGLAVLPARLKKEMAELEQAILHHEDLRQNVTMAAHADWAEEWMPKYEITESNIHSIVQKEIGIVFTKVLEDAGVYKKTEEGKTAFKRFIESL